MLNTLYIIELKNLDQLKVQAYDGEVTAEEEEEEKN
jgi:hypothetical protein